MQDLQEVTQAKEQRSQKKTENQAWHYYGFLLILFCVFISTVSTFLLCYGYHSTTKALMVRATYWGFQGLSFVPLSWILWRNAFPLHLTNQSFRNCVILNMAIMFVVFFLETAASPLHPADWVDPSLTTPTFKAMRINKTIWFLISLFFFPYFVYRNATPYQLASRRRALLFTFNMFAFIQIFALIQSFWRWDLLIPIICALFYLHWPFIVLTGLGKSKKKSKLARIFQEDRLLPSFRIKSVDDNDKSSSNSLDKRQSPRNQSDNTNQGHVMQSAFCMQDNSLKISSVGLHGETKEESPRRSICNGDADTKSLQTKSSLFPLHFNQEKKLCDIRTRAVVCLPSITESSNDKSNAQGKCTERVVKVEMASNDDPSLAFAPNFTLQNKCSVEKMADKQSDDLSPKSAFAPREFPGTENSIQNTETKSQNQEACAKPKGGSHEEAKESRRARNVSKFINDRPCIFLVTMISTLLPFILSASTFIVLKRSAVSYSSVGNREESSWDSSSTMWKSLSRHLIIMTVWTICISMITRLMTLITAKRAISPRDAIIGVFAVQVCDDILVILIFLSVEIRSPGFFILVAVNAIREVLRDSGVLMDWSFALWRYISSFVEYCNKRRNQLIKWLKQLHRNHRNRNESWSFFLGSCSGKTRSKKNSIKARRAKNKSHIKIFPKKPMISAVATPPMDLGYNVDQNNFNQLSSSLFSDDSEGQDHSMDQFYIEEESDKEECEEKDNDRASKECEQKRTEVFNSQSEVLDDRVKQSSSEKLNQKQGFGKMPYSFKLQNLTARKISQSLRLDRYFSVKISSIKSNRSSDTKGAITKFKRLEAMEKAKRERLLSRIIQMWRLSQQNQLSKIICTVSVLVLVCVEGWVVEEDKRIVTRGYTRQRQRDMVLGYLVLLFTKIIAVYYSVRALNWRLIQLREQLVKLMSPLQLKKSGNDMGDESHVKDNTLNPNTHALQSNPVYRKGSILNLLFARSKKNSGKNEHRPSIADISQNWSTHDSTTAFMRRNLYFFMSTIAVVIFSALGHVVEFNVQA